eukprot:2907413-Pleurochrysis_carterae.AAC.1
MTQLAIAARSRLAHHPVQSAIKRPRRTPTERPLFKYKSVKAMLELGNMELRRAWGDGACAYYSYMASCSACGV